MTNIIICDPELFSRGRISLLLIIDEIISSNDSYHSCFQNPI